MYIIVCHKCGEMKVISSIANNNGVTETYWTCSVCGTGQVVQLVSNVPTHRGSLRDVIAGIGFASGKKNYPFKPLGKRIPSIED